MAFAVVQNDLVHEVLPFQIDLGPDIRVIEVAPNVKVGWIVHEDGSATEPTVETTIAGVPPMEVARANLEFVRMAFDHYADHDLPVPKAIKEFRIAMRAILASDAVPEAGWPIMPELPSY